MCAASRRASNVGNPVSSVTSSYPARGISASEEEGGVARDEAGRHVELEPSLVLAILAVRDDDLGAVRAGPRRLGQARDVDEERERDRGPEPLERSREERIVGERLARVALL